MAKKLQVKDNEFYTSVGKDIVINDRLTLRQFKSADGQVAVEFDHFALEEPMLIKVDTLEKMFKKLKSKGVIDMS